MTEIYTHRWRRGKRRKKQRPKMTRLRLPFYTSSVKMLGFCIVHGVTYVQPKTARTNRITPKMSLATVCQNAAQPPKNRVICEASKGERRGAEKMLEAETARFVGIPAFSGCNETRESIYSTKIGSFIARCHTNATFRECLDELCA